MKLKSLLAIVSCSAIALSISIPSVAETVRDSKIESSSIGIGNKDYRNKQSTPSMVGNWKSSVENNEYRHLNPMEIYWDIKPDGTTTFAFRRKDGDGFADTTYKYAPITTNEGLWAENISSGVTALATIKWISNDEFVLIITKEPAQPEREGIQRKFVRIDEPVATILQERAQQAASRQKLERIRKIEEAEGEIKAVPHNTGIIIDTFRGGLYTGN